MKKKLKGGEKKKASWYYWPTKRMEDVEETKLNHNEKKNGFLERHIKGISSKLLHKMRYKGKRLGKFEQGRV